MANQITISMNEFMRVHPKLKYIFFGGKGGVGKTVMAGAAALWAAKQGKKTLLASTNPVHSLSNLLEKDVFGKAAVVCDEEKCYAFEIDTRDTIERSKQEIREKINWFLQFADITTKAEDFIESATMNPAFEESAMFENMIDIMFKDEYEFYVFDTAPTANARRLLGMSKVYSLWVEKMLKSREESKSLREILSFSKKKEKEDPLMDYLLGFKDRMGHAKELADGRQPHCLLLRDLARKSAHRSDYPIHQLVPRIRNSSGRRHRQWPNPERPGRKRHCRVRPQPSTNAGRTHGRNLEDLRRQGEIDCPSL